MPVIRRLESILVACVQICELLHFATAALVSRTEKRNLTNCETTRKHMHTIFKSTSCTRCQLPESSHAGTRNVRTLLAAHRPCSRRHFSMRSYAGCEQSHAACSCSKRVYPRAPFPHTYIVCIHSGLGRIYPCRVQGGIVHPVRSCVSERVRVCESSSHTEWGQTICQTG